MKTIFRSEAEVERVLSRLMSYLGRKNSPRKKAVARLNLIKARANRWPKSSKRG